MLQTLMYFLVYSAGGYLAHSLAIMTDAAHLLTDFGSMMVSLFSLWISSRPPTKTMNFGWHRSGQNEQTDTSEWMDGMHECLKGLPNLEVQSVPPSGNKSLSVNFLSKQMVAI